jgi:hypothetical protein
MPQTSKAWEAQQCHIRSTLRSESAGRKPSRWLEPSACLCRWPAAHRPQPLCRPRIQRPGTPAGPNSLSMRKKSPTSAWGRSTSSTRSTPARPTSGKRLHSGAEAAEAAEAAAEAAVAAAEGAVAVAEAAAAVFRGDIAASVRRGPFPTAPRGTRGCRWRYHAGPRCPSYQRAALLTPPRLRICGGVFLWVPRC